MNATAPRLLKFLWLRSDGLTQQWTLAPGQSLLIGRDPGCDCVLDGRKVSRRHCRVTGRADGRAHLQDAGSHNGTLVNGERVTETLLSGGERLILGEWEGLVEAMADEGGDAATTEMPREAPAARPAPVGPSPAVRPQSPRAPASPAPQHPWSWQESAALPLASESLRSIPVHDTPLVRRLSESSGALDFRGLSDLAPLDLERSMTPHPGFHVDAVALQFVFQMTESLHTADSMDAFLADMSESLRGAARARAVVVLLPEGEGGPLVPRVIQTRRLDENVHLSRTIIDHAIAERAAVTTEDASADERFASGESVLRFDLKAVLVVPLLRDEDAVGAVYLTRDLPFTDMERDLVAALAHLIAVGLERARLREQITQEERQRRALERFHAPDVVRRLMMQEKSAPSLAAVESDGLFLESLTATVLFCDLSGFTRFCEGHTPEQVGHLLNRYLGSMTEIVFRHGGTVDKYIGDAIMCIFGAPFMSDDDPIRAVRCANEMRRAFQSLCESGALGAERLELDVHIGINTGKVVAGTVGSALRMEYTALGDTVNLAARLEGVARAGQVLVGPATAALVSEHIPLRSLGAVAIKGKREAVEVFEVIDEVRTLEPTAKVRALPDPERVALPLRSEAAEDPLPPDGDAVARLLD